MPNACFRLPKASSRALVCEHQPGCVCLHCCLGEGLPGPLLDLSTHGLVPRYDLRLDIIAWECLILPSPPIWSPGVTYTVWGGTGAHITPPPCRQVRSQARTELFAERNGTEHFFVPLSARIHPMRISCRSLVCQTDLDVLELSSGACKTHKKNTTCT